MRQSSSPFTHPFVPFTWMGANDNFETADWVIVGQPYDGTCSGHPGTRYGPQAIRNTSYALETYSPIHDKNLASVKYFDAGNLELPLGHREKSLDIIYKTAQDVLNAHKKWVGVGGEHLVTAPVIKAYAEKYPDLLLVHFDAHADLRDEFMGEKFSHATAIRRAIDHLSPQQLLQIGIRSGTQDEFAFMQTHHTLMPDVSTFTKRLKAHIHRPVFITVDLDVFDPAYLPGTGTPEPGGISFLEFTDWLKPMMGMNLVGFDVLELSPHYDPSEQSTILAAKVIRDMLLAFN